MRFDLIILSSVAAVAMTCVTAAAYYYKSRKGETDDEIDKFRKVETDDEIDELFLFNDFNKLARYLLHIINTAAHTVDVYMPGNAIQARLGNAVLKQGINIRLVIDRNSSRDASDSLFLAKLARAGARVVCKLDEEYTPNSFCILDGKTLITGHRYWGCDRSSDVWNYLSVTNNREFVHQQLTQFNQQWYSIW